jgi:hypothetical protein
MGRDFFFSYSSADFKPGKKDDLFTFFQDLEVKLKEFARDEGGYFAAKHNESGVDWKGELETHLKSCHVLVPLYSPNYFKSPHCGREWKVYYDRFQENKTSPPSDVTRPEVILPVCWNAELLEPPKEASEIQDKTITESSEIYKTYGLSYMMRMPGGKAKAKYEAFVHTVGRRLVEMLKEQGDYKVRPIDAYDKIDPLFPPDSKRGLTFVRYVFLAGLKAYMGPHRPSWDGYGYLTNRRDWLPCLPEAPQRADIIASALATAAGKSFEFIEYIETDQDKLLKRLKYAKELENIVVIVVDPWSLEVPGLRSLAAMVESEPLPNSALVVMWNPEPSAKPLKMPDFPVRQSRNEYVDTVKSHEEFKQKLCAFFDKSRGTLTVSGKIPSAETGKPEPQTILKG